MTQERFVGPDRTRITTPLSTDAGRLARFDEVMADVARRLRGVCPGLSDAEFDALVRGIARVTVKYEVLAEVRAAKVDTPPGPQPAHPPD
jgi:hypothetical protein